MLLFDKVIDNLQEGSILDSLKKTNDTLEDILQENYPTNEDSLGQLCNKLSCVTIQMWHNQEYLYAVRKMTVDDFKEKYADSLDELHKIVKRCCDLNHQRSLLMDAIDKKAVEIGK